MGIQKLMARAAAEQFNDEQVVAFVQAEHKAGRMSFADASDGMRVAGRFEAEIKELLS